ncbi:MULTISPECIES: indole-3-glycerol-phosphate synthase [unclassified Methanoregula]|uniref:indole-3-glycerol phosphate synthase TrpC n=1 Tax=unclassified Methanoregula TaxID=2649730 RepID=UPI0009C8DC52|nr:MULTISPECIES: indole-3-glycerol phosphate synthase TrpC [unclassified Methanoregula]OPX61733.1 MAG: Indole-3-glycerol phosphate synthase [Methanoregula sp. PtaB.Bin085]OPY33958.1 MAG: Indole-3-glycerol phosphate synthase [Methanoregula sp. PtaU1.Bin006]
MILDEIIRRTERRVARLPDSFPEHGMSPQLILTDAIQNRNGRNAIIAEIKCASPSRGIIRRNVDIPMMAGVLEQGGCAALSVLTEPYFFGGTVLDIGRVKSAVNLPVLRKDFIIDERQIAESRALGADAVLLIAAILKDRLPDFVDTAIGTGLEPLVEVHTADEADVALATKAAIIGINNRNLATLGIDRSTTRILSERIRQEGRLVVSESGMRSADDVREMKPYCDAFLIGSSIMSHEHPRKKLEEFVCA